MIEWRFGSFGDCNEFKKSKTLKLFHILDFKYLIKCL